MEMGRGPAPSLSIQTYMDAEMEVAEPEDRESDDSPMDDADAASQISGSDCREMQYVKEQERLIRANEGLQASHGDKLELPLSASRTAESAGMDLLHKGYTVMKPH